MVPTEHPGKRATAQTSVESSGPLLEVPVESRARGHTSAPKPEPSWRVLLTETPSQRHVPRRTGVRSQHQGEGQASGCQVPRAVFGPWLTVLTPLPRFLSSWTLTLLKRQHSLLPLTRLFPVETPTKMILSLKGT